MLIDLFLQVTSDETVIKSGLDSLIKLSGKVGARLLIDLAALFVLIRLIYFKLYKNSDLLFTYLIFNVVIFFICFLLNKVELSMGAAFGLFAVFSMLRYRTEGISIKDMTYLFLVIAMGLINAVTKIKDAGDIYEHIFLVLVNSLFIGLTWFLEAKMGPEQEQSKTIYFERIELIHTGKEKELIALLKERTGLEISRIEITKIDFLKDAATIRVYYPSSRIVS